MAHARSIAALLGSLLLLFTASVRPPATDSAGWLLPRQPPARLLPSAQLTAEDLDRTRDDGRRLPLELVAPLLEGPDAELADSAEWYLASLDTPEANELVWARHPGEARILGQVRWRPARPGRRSTFSVHERILRELVLSPGGPDAVHALIFQGCFGPVHVRAALLYPEHTILWDGQDPGRYRRAAPEEDRRLRTLLGKGNLPALPSIEPMTSGETRYLYLTRDRARRVTLDFSWPYRQEIPAGEAIRYLVELHRTGVYRETGGSSGGLFFSPAG